MVGSQEWYHRLLDRATGRDHYDGYLSTRSCDGANNASNGWESKSRDTKH
jgi:hypothetical protein